MARSGVGWPAPGRVPPHASPAAQELGGTSKLGHPTLGGGCTRGGPGPPPRGPHGGQTPRRPCGGPTVRAEVRSLGPSGRALLLKAASYVQHGTEPAPRNPGMDSFFCDCVLSGRSDGSQGGVRGRRTRRCPAIPAPLHGDTPSTTGTKPSESGTGSGRPVLSAGCAARGPRCPANGVGGRPHAFIMRLACVPGCPRDQLRRL